MLEREEGRKPENIRRVMYSPLKKSRKGSEVLLKLSCNTLPLYFFMFCTPIAYDFSFHLLLVSQSDFHMWFFLRGERTNLTVFKQLSENVFKDKAVFIYIVKSIFFLLLLNRFWREEKQKEVKIHTFLDNDRLFITARETTEKIRSWGACNLSHVCERSCGLYWLIFLFAFHLNIELCRDVI